MASVRPFTCLPCRARYAEQTAHRGAERGVRRRRVRVEPGTVRGVGGLKIPSNRRRRLALGSLGVLLIAAMGFVVMRSRHLAPTRVAVSQVTVGSVSKYVLLELNDALLGWVAVMVICAPASEVVGLIGPPGSGKSTLLKCLGAVLEPATGRMSLGGQTIYDDGWKIPHVRALRRDSVGFVFQVPDLLTALDAGRSRHSATVRALGR